MTPKDDHDLLIEIKTDVKHMKESLDNALKQPDKCVDLFVKKNEIKHIVTAYYLISRTFIIAVASGLIYMVSIHAKSF